jgi:glycosyltransferase involved in cell wall biosynthesis
MIQTLVYGDGVSLDALALAKQLGKDKKISTMIYAERIDPRISSRVAKHYSKLPELNDEDIIIFHLSIGSKLNQLIKELKGRKIFRYHNITPPYWYRGYNFTLEALCEKGLAEVRDLAGVADFCYADSTFNMQDLQAMGYKCNFSIVPIQIPFRDYDKKPDQNTLAKYQDGYTNILFTGRIVPNKKHEDIIRAFTCYQKYHNKKSRLILAGSYDGMERYYEKLHRYTELLQVENVIFTGHIKFEELLAIYRAADVFLCLSEHEGFCIPLVEAMYFHIPIIAYAAAAVPETLGDAGILLQEKKPEEIAGWIDYVVRHKEQVQEYFRDKQEKQMMRCDRAREFVQGKSYRTS